MLKKVFLVFVWSLSLFFYLYQYTARASIPNVLNGQIMAYFSIDAIRVCGIFSSFYLIYMLMQIPVGYFLDKYGTKHTSFYAILSCALGLFIFTLTKNYYVAILGQIFVGIGASFAFILSLKLADEMFPSKYLPILSSIVNASGVSGSFLIAPFIAKISTQTSLKFIINTMSCIGVLLAFLMLFFVKHKKTRKKIDLDLLPKVLLLLKNKQVLLISFYSMMMYSVVVVFADHFGISYVEAIFHLPIIETSWICSSFYLGMIIGSPCFALLSNYYTSYKKALKFGLILSFTALSCLVFISLSPIMLRILMFMLGFAVASQILCFPAAISCVTHEISATTSSLVNTITTLSGVLIYPFIGLVMDISKSNNSNIYLIKDYRCGFSVLLITILINMFLLRKIKESYNN